jgi:hypothetical protein
MSFFDRQGITEYYLRRSRAKTREEDDSDSSQEAADSVSVTPRTDDDEFEEDIQNYEASPSFLPLQTVPPPRCIGLYNLQPEIGSNHTVN